MISILEVTLSLSENIRAGLAEGRLTRDGSVVRESSSGRIYAHLDEATRAGATDSDPGDIIETAILQSANLAAFFHMRENLRQISDAVQKTSEALGEIAKGINWVQQFNQAMLTGKIAAALEMAERGEASGDHRIIQHAWLNLLDAREQLGALLKTQTRGVERLSETFRAHKCFALLLNDYLLTAAAGARCEWLLYGPEAAHKAAHRTHLRIKRYREFLLSALCSFADYQGILLNLDSSAREVLRGTVRHITKIEQSAREQALQLEVCVQADLKAGEWEALMNRRHGQILLLHDMAPAA